MTQKLAGSETQAAVTACYSVHRKTDQRKKGDLWSHEGAQKEAIQYPPDRDESLVFQNQRSESSCCSFSLLVHVHL